MEGEPLPVCVRNTFLCDLSPSCSPSRRCLSAEPPAVCDRYAVQVHALMFRRGGETERVANRNESKATLASALLARASEEGASSPMCSLAETLESTSADTDRESATSRRTDSSESALLPPKVNVEFDMPAAQKIQDFDEDDEDEDSYSSPEEVAEDAEPSTSSIEALLEREGIDSLIQRVPRSNDGTLLTIGSIPHEEGACKPCVFAHSERKICQNGVQCTFCHFPHPPKRRLRFCKKKRLEIRRSQQEQ